MRREIHRLKTCLGRVYRDVGHKIAGDPAFSAALRPPGRAREAAAHSGQG